MVKKGYKQTEVGMIPEDWGCVAAKHLMKIETGSRNTEHKTDMGKYPFFVRSQKVEHIDTYHYNCEAVLTAGDGVGTGKVFHHFVGKFDAHQRVYVMSNFDGITGRYFYNYFSENFGKEVSKYTAKSSVDSVRRDMIAEMMIPLPPLEEQERIAEALSDVDNLIISLEKLIAKKKAIKQGTMQELLTGKKRLSGFSGEWIEKRIEDIIVRFATGLNPRQNFKLNSGGTNYYVTIKDFREGKLFLDDECDRIDDNALEKINERSDLKKNDLLFSSIGRIGDAYLITETPKNWNINESVFALRPNQQLIHPLMLYYLLTSEDIKNKLLDSTTGSTLKSIKLGYLKEITCCFPKEKEEQAAIATILSDMDSEIEALKEKLEKTRQVKQGMMQELLTGRIRLV